MKGKIHSFLNQDTFSSFIPKQSILRESGKLFFRTFFRIFCPNKIGNPANTNKQKVKVFTPKFYIHSIHAFENARKDSTAKKPDKNTYNPGFQVEHPRQGFFPHRFNQ